jgi:nitroreductase
MDIFEAKFICRSICIFTGETIHSDDIKTILRAGCFAPSAPKKQSWHVIIIQNPETLQAITEKYRYV